MVVDVVNPFVLTDDDDLVDCSVTVDFTVITDVDCGSVVEELFVGDVSVPTDVCILVTLVVPVASSLSSGEV